MFVVRFKNVMTTFCWNKTNENVGIIHIFKFLIWFTYVKYRYMLYQLQYRYTLKEKSLHAPLYADQV